MIHPQLLAELDAASARNLLSYTVTIDNDVYIRFTNTLVTLQQIVKVQQHIEWAYNYRADVLNNPMSIMGPVIFVHTTAIEKNAIQSS